MPILTSISKKADDILAAFIFFTRLPFWRIHQPPKECYSSVVEHWPLTGWLTALITCTVIAVAGNVLPLTAAVIAALATRALVTGALHEDGLADFADGFGGGGNNRQRILDIMKDSHIGTYGVIALVLYYAMATACLSNMTEQTLLLTVLAADPYSKMLTAQLTQMLPYARSMETSKAHVVYRRYSTASGISLFLQGMIPMIPLVLVNGTGNLSTVIFAPCIVMFLLYLLMRKRLNGYTGDCCGAAQLILELTIFIAMAME